MAVTLEQVTMGLMPDEPRYGRLAVELGADALPHLTTLIQGDDLGLASKAASLATLIEDKRSLDVLSHAVTSEHEVVRIAAAAGLWRLEQFGIGPLLVPLMRDAQPSVRLNAAKSAVREPADPEVAKTLEVLQVRDDIPFIRETAADVLRRIEGAERLSRAVRGGGPLVDEKMLAALGKTVRAPQLYTAFAEAAFDDDVWNDAVKAPVKYLRGKGLRLPRGFRVVLTEHRHRHPWPDRETELQLVVVRCFWLWGAADPDEEPQPPTHFCIEVPVFLLDFIRGLRK
jgi:HEAT repeats